MIWDPVQVIECLEQGPRAAQSWGCRSRHRVWCTSQSRRCMVHSPSRAGTTCRGSTHSGQSGIHVIGPWPGCATYSAHFRCSVCTHVYTTMPCVPTKWYSPRVVRVGATCGAHPRPCLPAQTQGSTRSQIVGLWPRSSLWSTFLNP